MAQTYTLGELAKKVDARVIGDEGVVIRGLATLQDASSGELSFLANPLYEKYLESTQATAVIVSEHFADKNPVASLVHSNPYLAYAKLSNLWDPVGSVEPVISDRSSIAETASIGEGVRIGAGVSIGEHVTIEAGVYLGENVVVGDGSKIGKNTRIYPNVTIYHNVSIGSDCVVQAGVVIGSDGFGFAPTGKGWQRIAQLGGVRIGDRVEIGANTCIDRGALGDTEVHDGVILDNQIQIAHNVVVGENTAIAACSAIAGSTRIGKNCIVGGASGIAGHLDITDGVHITAMTMVIKSLPEAGVYSSGTGVQSNKDWKKSIARLRRLDKTEARLKALEQKLENLNESDFKER